MKTKLLFIIFIVCISNCYSQNWLWARSSVGIGRDESSSQSADAFGNVFATGYFNSPTITFGNITLSNTDSTGNFQDIFIVKYDANGNILWAKSVGGTNNDEGYAVSADASGNVFVTGWFSSPTLNFGYTTLNSYGNSSIFIAKYDANGNMLWAKNAGGGGQEAGLSINADANGNVFISGYSTSSFITFGSITLNNSGNSNPVFIAKYDANGNALWAKSPSGVGAYGYSVSADAVGHVFLTGSFPGYAITFGSIILTNHNGGTNVFIAKYDAYGNVLWAKKSGGNGEAECYSGSADACGNVVITGRFFGPTITFDTITLTNSDISGNSDDIFIAKYDANGNVLR